MSQKPLASASPVVFLMGATATGKTDTACALFDCAREKTGRSVELINVDSTQVYKGMDIGSAKMSAEELLDYPHHLIDIKAPHEAYSAAEFRLDALRLIEEIHQRDAIPVFVGGTMMYFKLLREGMADLPQANAETRTAIEEMAAQYGWPYVHEQLRQVDAVTAERLPPNDKQRIQRAYEVYLMTGKTISQHYAEQPDTHLPYPLLQMALYPEDRAWLHDNIAKRFKIMLAKGFVEEVEALRKDERLKRSMPSMRSAGYSQVWDYLSGELSYAEMEERGIIITRQLAKRQLTWTRNWQGINVVSFGAQENKQQKVNEIVGLFAKFVG